MGIVGVLPAMKDLNRSVDHHVDVVRAVHGARVK